MATVQDIIEQASTKVNGEYEAIVETSSDFKTYLNVLNQVMRQWVETPYVKWQSLYNMNYTLPNPVANGTLVYPVANAQNIIIGNTPFDSVYFIDGSGNVVDRYKMTDQAFFDATTDTTVCALFSDGLHLKATPTKLIGTTIRLPAYVKPAKYTSASQEVLVDSDTWLVTEMAGFICDSSPVPFIARNADKYHKEAEIYMKTMRDNNRRRQHLVIKDWNEGRHTWADVLQVMTMRDLYHGK